MIKPNYIENREISWLKFNERVLEEAISKENPLLEQLKFLSIFESNLDEFFMIRVGTMLDYVKYVPEYKDSRTGMTAQEQLEEIYKKVTELYKIKDKIYKELMENLKKEGIRKEKINNLSKKEIDYLEKYFYENVYPFLSPLIIDTWHPFPFILNKKLNIIVYLEVKELEVLGMIPVPENIERIIMLNTKEGKYILLEELILYFTKNIFSMYRIKESSIMRITRNMDIETDMENYDENIDYRQYMKQIIKKRNKLEPLRMEVQSQISDKFLGSLLKRLNLNKKQIFFSECPMLYTDYSLITSDEEIGRDADVFFKNMSLGNLRGVYKKLWVAPSSFKQNILKNIDQEIEKVKNGGKGTVVIKCNSFTDNEIINKMVEASNFGVKITLIIRGICCIIPGIVGKTENIKVISVVGRFLEHSRIYSFGELNEQVIYIYLQEI